MNAERVSHGAWLGRSLSAAFAAGASFCVQATVVLENDSSTNVVAATDGALAETLRGDWRMRGVEKTGPGAWTLGTGYLDTVHDLPVLVREGRLSVTDEGSTDTGRSTPTEILRRASLWLDATANVVYDDANAVSAWYDVREARLAGGGWSNGWCRAVAGTSIKTNSTTATATPPTWIAEPTGSTLPMLYFNGYSYGSWMALKTSADANKDFTGMRHVFAVLNQQTYWGFPLATRTGSVFMHTGGQGKLQDRTDSRYLSPQSASPSANRSTFYLDGLRCNPALTPVKKGVHLIEFKAGMPAGQSMGYLYNDRDIAGRYGGDYIGEVLIFDVTLTTAERLAVEDYLMAKWGIAPAVGRLQMKTSPSAEVVFSEGRAPLISGEGTIVKTGSETADFEPSSADSPAVRVRIAAGSLRAMADEINYAFLPGTRLAATESYGVSALAFSQDNTLAAKGAAELTGVSGAAFRIGDQTNALKRLTLSSPSAILGARPASADTRVLGGNDVYATIANGNGSFETGMQNQTGTKATCGNWTVDATFGDATDPGGMVHVLTPASDLATFGNTGGNTWWYGFNSTGAWTTYDYRRFLAPNGAKVLVFKRGGRISTSVEVPVTGDYEFTFQIAGRISYGSGDCSLALVDANDTTNRFAHFFGKGVPDGFEPVRYRLRHVEAGAYTFVFEMRSTGANDRHVMVDDFRMRLLADSCEGAVSVPNGDFEDATHVFDKRETFSSTATARGWTLTQGEQGAASDTPINIEIGVADAVMSSYYNEVCTPFGRKMLTITGNDARATTAPFRLPPGSWRLRCRASRWGFTDQGLISWHGSKYLCNPKVGALVKVNGATRFDAVSSALSSYDMADVLFADVLTVGAEDDVTLEVRQAATPELRSDGTYNIGIVCVDDFEFVPVAAVGGELVKNGSFEDAAGTFSANYWTLKYNNVAGDSLLEKSACRSQNYDNNYGYAKGVGERALLITQIGEATQPLDVPEDGYYEFSFWTRSRYGATDLSRWWGWNVLRVSLVGASDGATNVILTTGAIGSTNFLRQAALFYAKAGSYTLRIQGMNDGTTTITTPKNASGSYLGTTADANAYVDGVSIRRASGTEPPALDEKFELELTDPTAKVRLDYVGTLTLGRLKVAGQNLVGEIDATHPSGLVQGIGRVFVRPRGTIVIIR